MAQRPVFEGELDAVILDFVKGGGRPEPTEGVGFPPAFAPLMEGCWQQDPMQRPTFSEIVGRLQAMARQEPRVWQVADQARSGLQWAWDASHCFQVGIWPWLSPSRIHPMVLDVVGCLHAVLHPLAWVPPNKTRNWYNAAP